MTFNSNSIYITILVFIATLFNTTLAQTIDVSDKKETIAKVEHKKVNDSVDSLHAKLKDSIEYVPIEKFLHAGSRRATIDGSLPYEHTHVKPLNATIIGATLTGIFIVQHEMQQNTIWKKVGPFHFDEDAKWSLYLDKGGHFFGTYLPCYIFSETLMTSGFSWDMSVILGSSLGLAYTGYVEVLDGFSTGFGFSPSDFYADVAGAGFFLAQHYVPYLQNFSPKFMYVRPAWIGEYNRAEATTFIDDYSSQVFWMSANVHNMLPGNLKPYWPDWLELSLGYAVYSLAGNKSLSHPGVEENANGVMGNQKVIIALDYNLVKLLPDGGYLWNWFRQSLNHFKLPSPAIEIGKRNTRFTLLYPFKF